MVVFRVDEDDLKTDVAVCLLGTVSISNCNAPVAAQDNRAQEKGQVVAS